MEKALSALIQCVFMWLKLLCLEERKEGTTVDQIIGDATIAKRHSKVA
jgi:hypothetical protein